MLFSSYTKRLISISDLLVADYLFIELVAGVPRVGINLGDGDVLLEVTENTITLNDGQWHQLQIFRNNLVHFMRFSSKLVPFLQTGNVLF